MLLVWYTLLGFDLVVGLLGFCLCFFLCVCEFVFFFFFFLNFPFAFQFYYCIVDVTFSLFCLCVHYKFLTNKSQRVVNQNKYLGLGFLFEKGL